MVVPDSLPRTHRESSEQGPFWSLFHRSRIPMALVDRECCYVAANDAAVDLYQYRRDDVIGTRAGRNAIHDYPQQGDAEWERLLGTNELYGERVIELGSGTLMRVSFAAHGTSVNGDWLALFVTLSAHLEPDGGELIGTVETDWPGHPSSKLTPREREVVRRVALGASTRQIAAELYLSPATVRSHVRNAMVKTNAHTRAQLVAIVLGDGMMGPPPTEVDHPLPG
jgi:DNA-binding CsgD family transcriptional regulator